MDFVAPCATLGGLILAAVAQGYKTGFVMLSPPGTTAIEQINFPCLNNE
jgi:hypothetical protein